MVVDRESAKQGLTLLQHAVRIVPMARKRTFTEQLRHLIETSGESYGAIARATGVDKATISRFMNGRGGLSMPNLDALAAHLGWTVTSKRKPRKSKGI